MASKLVEQWLKIAKGETMTITNQTTNIVNKENLLNSQSQIIVNNTIYSEQNVDSNELNSIEVIPISEVNENDLTDGLNGDLGEVREDGLILKFTVKDGKPTVDKVDSSPRKGNRSIDSLQSSDGTEKSSRDEKMSSSKSSSSKSSKDRERDKSKDSKDRSSHDKHKKSSSSSSSHKSSSHSTKSSSSSKHSSSSKTSNSSSNNSSSKSHKSSSHSSSSKDKDNKHKSSSSSSKSSSRDKEKRDEKDNKSKSDSAKLSQAEKDKNTLAKIAPPIPKVGRIPKKTSDDSEKNSADASLKKKSISIEVRKDTENRPKTVKTYNSQFRSHGLGEEAPPPPSRKDLKKPATTPTPPGLSIVTNTLPKRSLSPTNVAKDPEKKIKLSTSSPTIEKPGAIKLIPPKPKRKYRIELNQINIDYVVCSQVIC